ncbi:hypothetical protein BCR34DRAFT_199733 [Clohesyomyces aquaticus]|uniref:Uncharacterized protein n=1 Tax=Clohesyomyces aquaticus TaxID=1231657 RepID=A0A1Y1YC61_9PLEO|nr:hypothetical protein BCR34DRAFT_199733 [Clohesyomyces aquaticus]
MGAGLSTQPETVEELCEIYRSPSKRSGSIYHHIHIHQAPEHVRQRLLETLYSGCVPSYLVNRFYAQNIRDSGSPRVWTESTFADFLIRAHPGLEIVVKPAIQVLFRIVLHHGCYPFKPGNEDIGITLEGLATAVALLTSADRTSITIREEEIEGDIFERPRDWTERCRLLFQSVCDTDWGRVSSDDKQISDDEDLLDALDAGIPERERGNVPCEILQEVGSTLPSSHSCKLNGRVSLQDMGDLLRFLLGVMSGHPQSSTSVVDSGLDGVISALLNAFEPREGGVDWTLFKAVLHKDMVRYSSKCTVFA